MKSLFKLFLLVPLFGMFLLTSCEEEVIETPTEVITDDEAADLVENSLAIETSGMAEQTETVAAVAPSVAPQSFLCGLSYDTTITRIRTTGARTYDYTFTWNWILNCPTNNYPTQLFGTYTMDGVYDTPRMSSDDDATHTYTVDNLNTTDSFYVWNGSYLRNGSQTSKVRNQHTFTSVINITTTNVHIDKTTRQIISGTGTFTITASLTNGTTKNVTGSFIFNGNGTATISVNGNTYTVQIQ